MVGGGNLFGFPFGWADEASPCSCRAGPWHLDKASLEPVIVFMNKKNLGRWLAAASSGEDIGIICGADIIGLRRVEVESTDYARCQYGAAPEQVAALEQATDRRFGRLKRSGEL